MDFLSDLKGENVLKYIQEKLEKKKDNDITADVTQMEYNTNK